MTPKQIKRRKVVEEVEVDSQYGDLIIHLKPGWCWEEQGAHTRGYPPEDKDMIQDDMKYLIEPCYCEDCKERK